jgi:uncharacterized protein (TIGR00251 family)
VTPGAKHSEIIGVADDRLRVRLAARAVEGRANDELIRFLARELGVRRDEVIVAAGARSRRKLLRVHGVTIPEARRRLGL